MSAGIFRWFGAAFAIAIFAYVLTTAPVVPSEQTWPALALPLFRVVFAILLWVRLHRLGRRPLMVWATPYLLPGGRRVTLGQVLAIWQLFALALAAGLATPIAAGACFACELVVFSRTYTRSLEDVLFQAVLFFLIFVGAGGHPSVDAWLGLGWIDPFDHVLARNVWWLSFALIMFSAGFEKLCSPLWRRGLGFNYFVGLPHLVQRPFTFLRQFERFGWMLSWTTVIAELSLLPAALLPEARVVVTLVLVGFAISLFVVVDLSFIGQVTLLVLLLFGSGDAAILLHRTPATGHAPGASPLVLAALALCAVAIVGVTEVPLGFARRFFAAVSRFTIGVIPNRVFTEVQLYGIYIYRVVAVGADGTERPLVQTFLDDGSQGPLQRWEPRVYLKFTYEVTDYCLRYLRDGEQRAQSTSHYAAVEALMRAAFAELGGSGAFASKVVLYVRSVEADEAARSHDGRFTMSDWVGVLECTVANGTLGAPVHVSVPPPIRNTRRLA